MGCFGNLLFSSLRSSWTKWIHPVLQSGTRSKEKGKKNIKYTKRKKIGIFEKNKGDVNTVAISCSIFNIYFMHYSRFFLEIRAFTIDSFWLIDKKRNRDMVFEYRRKNEMGIPWTECVCTSLFFGTTRQRSRNAGLINKQIRIWNTQEKLNGEKRRSIQCIIKTQNYIRIRNIFLLKFSFFHTMTMIFRNLRNFR